MKAAAVLSVAVPSVGGPVVPDPAQGISAALRIAAHLRVLADGMEAAADVYPVFNASTAWTGLAAEDLRHLLQSRPNRFRVIAGACRGASQALIAHAEHLQTAAQVWQAAERAPVEAAGALRRQAGVMAASSAQAAAARLAGLAASAPPPPNWHQRVTETVEDWRGELMVGGGESAGALVGLAFRVGGVAANVFDRRTLGEARAGVAGLGRATAHPFTTLKTLADWDTWRSNPVRALGHLAPDVAGGKLGWVRGPALRRGLVERLSTRADARFKTAVAERQALPTRAAQARRARAEEALRAEAAPGSKRWIGPEDVELPPQKLAQAMRFHELAVLEKRRLTRVIKQVSREAGVDLVGLVHAAKQPDSFLRKIVKDAGPRQSIERALAEAHDAVRFTVTIDPAHYLEKSQQVALALTARGFHLSDDFWNAWKTFEEKPGSRYRGLNSSWVDSRTGTVFEVQFHTPKTWAATRRTHRWYETWRLKNTPAEQKSELARKIRAHYAKAGDAPPGVLTLGDRDFIPPTLRVEPRPVPDLRGPAGATGALAPQLVTADGDAR